MPVENEKEDSREGSSVRRILMNLLDGAGVCVLVAAGENGRIISANPAACGFLGRTAEELKGYPSEDALRNHSEDGLRVQRELVEENGAVFQVLYFRTTDSGVDNLEKQLEKSSAFFG